MKTGVTLAAGVLALSLLATTAQADGRRGGHYQPRSYPYSHSYGHHGSHGLAVAAGITGALFGVAALADALSPHYVGPPVVYQAPPPVYYYPAPRVYYYTPAPAYYGPPTVYYRPAPY